MLLVLVLFHLFPFWSLGQRNGIPARLDLYSRLCSAHILCCYFFTDFAIRLLNPSSHSKYYFHCALCLYASLFSLPLSVALCIFQARAFECSLNLHWEIYTISLILIGYDDLVWRTKKTRKPELSWVEMSWVWFSLQFSQFDSIRICVSIYTRSRIVFGIQN